MINLIFLLVTISFIISGIYLFMHSLLKKRQENLKILFSGERLYSDTESNPGVTLYSESLPLAGKPDYLLKNGKYLIPVEIKTGKTPYRPYRSHIMQLTAYCRLVKENYGIRPVYGVIRYPEKEFLIEYTNDNLTLLEEVIGEMLSLKNNEDLFTEDTQKVYYCSKCKIAIN